MTNHSLGGILVAATLLAPAAAFAQSEPADSPATLEEVIVTAQRREEKLKDVPIAITAVTSQQLQETGVSSSMALTTITPGLNFVSQGAYAQPTIRGIGTAITGAGADANVAIYVDGVYQPSQASNAFEFNNVERIEVLKGPQGTLFGRNATGGAINITTKQPSFDANGEISLGIGNFEARSADLYVTGPLGDRFAADLAMLYKEDEGYVYNMLHKEMTGKINAFGLRTKLLFQATDDLSFVLTGNFSRNSNNAAYLTKPIDGNLALLTNPLVVIPKDVLKINNDTDPISRSTNRSGSLVVKYDMGAGLLTSTSSYSELDVELLVDSDVTNLPTSTNDTFLPQKTFTQEFNYTSSLDGPLNFTAGLFYYDDVADRRSINSKGVGGPITQDFSVTVATQAAAVYGEINYDITDSFRVIGGLRYSSERKQADGSYTVGPATVLDSSVKWDAWTPRLSLLWKLTDRSNVYATYSRGFKSGAYNTTTLTSPTPVDPESVDAFEVGFKHSGPRLVANMSMFYYDYKDIQVSVQTKINNITTGIYQNAATAKIYGIDGDVTALFNENWKLRVGAAYTHAQYDEWTNALITTPLPNGFGNSQATGDASGNNMIRTPEWMINSTLAYNTDVGYGHIDISGTVSYNSGFFIDPGNNFEHPAYTLFNAQLAWTSPDEKYRLEFWGRNLTDELYYVYSTASPAGYTGAIQRPRSFGVTLTRSFD
ncbi:MAG: putative TonB-dependent receptor [Caulobacter sp.]|nr:putative TonB-dependent receptor [Caulobacter sp.]